ncbi:glutamate racemase [Variovorax sp.]|uniref:glutamate racemase n=1 Tax=Variovorax sp. TaxID=1871043 RepID=UPI002D42A2C0|nr:glutamate racemase [Variovorax sp.]HYP86433.1 glutamate racemase [Variovorax sp.]
MTFLAAGATQPDAAVGVFDSGVGGLSVLRALQSELPGERFVYFSDSAHAPYGERDEAQVRARTLAVAAAMREQAPGIKLLVVACNTATAAAVHALRERWPDLPVVGVEPALKPAALHSRSGAVVVLATRGTLHSAKYQSLRQAVAATHPALDVRGIACDGLAAAIEAGDAASIDALAARYLAQAGPLGNGPGMADCVVLGCTHYPFALDTLRRHVPEGVTFIDTGIAVARQARRLISQRHLLRDAAAGHLELRSTGDAAALHAFASQWLSVVPDATSPCSTTTAGT